ncbi:MAG: hypothetical protein COA45_11505 [Zetaproteobacteria bacterium]|nr:MAG: hypothetical protein COA45_11505 [Zetaproteobacteria bacterium]
MENENPADKFVAFVREYCTWSESKARTETEEVKTAIKLLANLYANVLAMPNDNLCEDIDGSRISDEEWNVVFKRFGALPFNFYSTFFSPHKLSSDEHCVGDLADDLADIYRDLKCGHELYERGHVKEAFREWKQSFNMHWGRHLSSALNALHAYADDEGIEL